MFFFKSLFHSEIPQVRPPQSSFILVLLLSFKHPLECTIKSKALHDFPSSKFQTHLQSSCKTKCSSPLLQHPSYPNIPHEELWNDFFKKNLRTIIMQIFTYMVYYEPFCVTNETMDKIYNWYFGRRYLQCSSEDLVSKCTRNNLKSSSIITKVENSIDNIIPLGIGEGLMRPQPP